MLWCPLDWVSKIKTDSSGLILTLLYYTAAVTGFSAAAFTKTRFSPIYDPLSPCLLAWILWNWLSYKGLPCGLFARLPKWPQNNFGKWQTHHILNIIISWCWQYLPCGTYMAKRYQLQWLCEKIGGTSLLFTDRFRYTKQRLKTFGYRRNFSSATCQGRNMRIYYFFFQDKISFEISLCKTQNISISEKWNLLVNMKRFKTPFRKNLF